MGGELGEGYRSRSAFYCLRQDKAPEGGLDVMVRPSYEFNVADNTVDITASVVTLTTTDHNDEWNMDFSVDKSYAAALGGQLTIFLDETMVDLSKDVTVNINGEQRFSGKVTPMRNTALESCALFGDPRRIFPVKIQVGY